MEKEGTAMEKEKEKFGVGKFASAEILRRSQAMWEASPELSTLPEEDSESEGDAFLPGLQEQFDGLE
eukprot:15837970-Heterocapsa_arctica.AAC.1